MIGCISMGKRQKLSKSDKIDKEQEAKDKAWLSSQVSSPHFTVGTFVLYDGRRYEVMYRWDNALLLRGESHEEVTVFPYALSREASSR